MKKISTKAHPFNVYVCVSLLHILSFYIHKWLWVGAFPPNIIQSSECFIGSIVLHSCMIWIPQALLYCSWTLLFCSMWAGCISCWDGWLRQRRQMMCEGEREEEKKEREMAEGESWQRGHLTLFGQQFVQNDAFFSQVVQLIIVRHPGGSRWCESARTEKCRNVTQTPDMAQASIHSF